MKTYLAPLEGITGYIYRNAYHTFFPDFDKYFLPFIAPHEKRCFNAKEKNDLLPEHNTGMHAVPQVLTNRAADFIQIAEKIADFGYEEINLNLGCPSGTVAAKGRGSGFLAHPKELDRFLDEIFSKTKLAISIKTRVGKDSYEEWQDLLEIFLQYPVKELIVHPRIQKDFYKNTPHMESFAYAVDYCEKKGYPDLCYNGDLVTTEDIAAFRQAYPGIDAIMLGRGIIRNPGLYGEMLGSPAVDKKTLQSFHDKLYADYTEEFSGDRNVLFKMKEIWSYMIDLFVDDKKYGKKIRKAQHAAEYESVVRMLFADAGLKTGME